MAAENFIGKQFGRLTVIEVAGRIDGRQRLLCRCICGNTSLVTLGNIKRTKSCGCVRQEEGFMARLDLTGKIFDRLTVIKRIGIQTRRGNKKETRWLCQCICGKTTQAATDRLTTGHKRSCGCLSRDISMASAKNLLGRRFGRLTVIARQGSKAKRAIWLCACECGNNHYVTGKDLNNGGVRSCGCLRYESRANDLIDQDFGLLTVIERAGSQNGKALWLCKCVCGKVTYVTTGNLNSGLSSSCNSCNRSRTTSEFIDLATILHRHQYDYSKVIYGTKKVEILCRSHGSFWQAPAEHLRGFGCNQCNNRRRRAYSSLSAQNQQRFDAIIEAIEIRRIACEHH